MRKPSFSASIMGLCKLIKLGHLLAVGEVSRYSQNSDALVALVAPVVGA